MSAIITPKIHPNCKFKGKFVDISNERRRSYRFPDGSSLNIEIPIWLNVSKNGEHRIIAWVNDKVKCYYIKTEQSLWVSWESKTGGYHFVM